MAKTPAPAKTPAVAIARVLRSLGLKQGEDFSVSGQYRGTGENRERVGTYATLYTREANDIVAARADDIEEMVKRDGGWGFSVSVRYSKLSGLAQCDITNFVSRVREEDPRAQKVADTPAGQVTAAVAEATEPKADVCCVCDSDAPVVYRNYKGQPFCAVCVNGDRSPADLDAKLADVAKRLPSGTRVQWTGADGIIWSGTVNGLDLNVVTVPGHRNYGRVYLGVSWDGGIPFVRSRPFADELTVIGPVDPATLVGTEYTKAHTHYRNGFPEAYTLTATVREIIRGYTDPWTGAHAEVGVRFSILDDSRGWTSYHTLSLADFMKHWVDA